MFKDIRESFLILWKYSPFLVGMLVFLQILSGIVLPLNLNYFSILINGIVENTIDTKVMILFCVLSFIVVLMDYFIQKFSMILKLRSEHQMISKLLDKCKLVPYQSFENSETLDVLNLAIKASEGKITDVFSESIAFISNIIKLASFVWLFAKSSYLLAIIYVIVLAFIMLFDFKAINLMNKMFQKQSKNERLFDYYEQELSNRHTITYLKVINGLGLFRKKIMELSTLLADERINTTKKAQKYSIASRITILSWFVLSLVLLSLSVYSQKIQIGLFTVLVSILSMALGLSESISVSFSNIAQDSFYIKKYLEWVNMDEEIRKADINNVKHIIDISKPIIEFRNVSFSYPNFDKLVLDELNLSIYPEQTVALVGYNGCGKSTIIKLILGLYKPVKGEVLLNGKSINEYSDEALKSVLSVVFQDFAKYDLSIRENVSISCIEEKSDDIKIRNALEFSGLSDFSNQLDMELGKMVKESADLSQGQWQRVAISRAIFLKNTFVLFDEPLSASDPIVEAETYKHIYKLMKNRGCILISHRLGSARLSSRIIVLNNGKIAEDGTHEELMLQNGIYANMFEEQKKWYVEVNANA